MRIEDISPRDDNTAFHRDRDYQSVSGKALCCALSKDGTRAYLGGNSGIWRSDNGGLTWRHLEWPQPPLGTTVVPGALLVTNVYDLLVSPSNPNIVLAATGRDARSPDQGGVWRSANGGATWRRVHRFSRAGVVQPATCLAVAPDDPSLIYAAGGVAVAISRDGGLTWTETEPQQAPAERVWYVAVGRRRQGRVRFVYAVGSRVWYSVNGGSSWRVDAQPLRLDPPSDGPGQCARSIGIHPGNSRALFVATFESEIGNVWRGDFALGSPPVWRRLAPLPWDFPGTTPSGTSFVLPHVAPNGEFYLIASDRRTTQSSVGEPSSSADWLRIEDTNCHLDPHGLAVTREFQRQLPYGPRPANAGRILLVNDGGANVSGDGAKSWANGRELSSLGIVNVAVNPLPSGGAAICMGMGDNSGFSSPDDGASWETQDYVGGDNDCAFADPMLPSLLVVFAPRAGRKVFLYKKAGGVPDAAVGTSDRTIIPNPSGLPDPNDTIPAGPEFGSSFVSFYHSLGYRPLILTMPGEARPDDIDIVTFRYTLSATILLRARRLSAVTDETQWDQAAQAGAPVQNVGPPLPTQYMNVVQASGGHASPTYFVADLPATNFRGQSRLWKWRDGMRSWQEITPGSRILRFYVNPYNPALIYAVTPAHVLRSDVGGTAWKTDTSLERAATENGAFPFMSAADGVPGQALIRDMLFDPYRPSVRFAVGPAGVFQTLDGVRWTPLVVATAAATQFNNAAYDFASCPRALYVATNNRGLLRLRPLAPDWDYPPDSLQVATGRISLLRVHDKGTGYGPPSDFIDAEVIVWLDSEPEKAFGFQLRDNAERRVAEGMLALLRDAFNANRVVRLEFIRSGCRTGRIMRVISI